MSQQTIQNESRSSPSVTITVDPGLSLARPMQVRMLESILSYDEIQFRATAEGQLQRRVVTIPLCRPDDDGVIFATGCLQRVISHLHLLGYDIDIRRQSHQANTNLHIDESRTNEAEAAFPQLASALQSNFNGLFEVAHEERRSSLIGFICYLFHGAKIFIACKTIHSTNHTAALLGDFVGGNVGAVHGCDYRSPYRVTCGTFASLNHSNSGDWDIVIFVDAFEGIKKVPSEARGEFCRRRVYAIVDPRKRQTPRDQLLFETLAGPVIYRDPCYRPRQTTEFVAAFAQHASYAVRLEDSARDRRFSLWRDSVRNRAIADIAVAIANRDESTLFRHEIPQVLDEPFLRPNPGVTILVESLEHGQEIAALLPNWTFLHSRSESDSTARAYNVWGVPRNSIVTAVAAHNIRLFESRTLIWASGGDLPYIPEYIARSPSSYLLIDFSDDGNHLLASDTLCRLAKYKALGCRMLGGSQSALERHLAHQIETSRRSRHRNTSRRPRRQNRVS